MRPSNDLCYDFKLRIRVATAFHMNTSGLQNILKDLHSALTRHYGPRLDRLILFGSHARGDAGEGSDIDVLVVLQGEVHPEIEIEETGRLVSSLSLENSVAISCFFISIERYLHKQNPLLLNIQKEGIAIAS